jgi:predicted amidohydrolase
VRWARDLAHELNIWLLAGSIIERAADGNYNTACLLDPQGQLQTTYRKVHLFDSAVPGAALCESAYTRPGRAVGVTEVGRVKTGLAICYDLRFPELFRVQVLAGARLVLLPAAFTERTGRDHWEVLVRARAIENQVFVVAAGQVGTSAPNLRWYGRSMIVDPWGVVLAQAPDREAFIACELDFTAQDAVREQLPCLANRRPEAYDGPR